MCMLNNILNEVFNSIRLTHWDVDDISYDKQITIQNQDTSNTQDVDNIPHKYVFFEDSKILMVVCNSAIEVAEAQL